MAEDKTNKENTEINDPFSGKSMFAIDKGLGALMSAKGPKPVDTSNIDKAIAGLEKPASGSVYDKLAARYRSQGEGAVLRTQKNLANLFGSTINLIQEREADALARYTLLKDQLKDFDDSTIFGEEDGSEMPIADEIKNLVNITKINMREISRLNPASERYDFLRKKIEKNNKAIVEFDEINKKLLQIRNSQDGSNDPSQWSKGMTQSEIDMWTDIYTGKGNNIKIQDGKLVWTDATGQMKYNFDDISDYGPKREALGYSADGNFDNDSDLGILHFYTMDGSKQRDRKSLEKITGTETKRIQKSLNNLGFTDDDGNKLDVDGDFGDKTEEAYKKYLAKKDELEQAYLDKNLSEEDKQKYGSIVEGSVGQTKVIDLNTISNTPTMIQNKATILERQIQGQVQDLINKGVKITDPNYESTVETMIFQLNGTGPAGIKSLIFDGLNTNPKDLFTSENTNSFIQSIISNPLNADEFGIKDPQNITPQEIASAIQKLKEGDVTIQYFNEDGEKQSLQRQFLGWYKSLIDAKVETGTKSKFSTTTGQFSNTTNTTNTTTRNNNNKSGAIDITKTGVNISYGVRGAATTSSGNTTVNGYELKAGEVGLTYDDINKIIQNDNELKKYFNDNFYSEDPVLDFKIMEDNTIKFNNGAGWRKSSTIDGSTPQGARLYNKIMQSVQTKLAEKGQSFIYTPLEENFTNKSPLEAITNMNSYEDAEKRVNMDIDSISQKGGFFDDHLLDYGSGSKIVNAFNDRFEKYGFYAVQNDDGNQIEGSNDNANFYHFTVSETPGEGRIRIYYKNPSDGLTVQEFYDKFGYYKTESIPYGSAERSYIDITHDSLQKDRRGYNEQHLQNFMRYMLGFTGEGDVGYWNEEAKYSLNNQPLSSDFSSTNVVTYE